jgi:hypothetical protein
MQIEKEMITALSRVKIRDLLTFKGEFAADFCHGIIPYFSNGSLAASALFPSVSKRPVLI